MFRRPDGDALAKRDLSRHLVGIRKFVATRSTLCHEWVMPETIAQRKLRNENSKVIDAVVAGETFVVTRSGVPMAKLRPIVTTRRTFVPTAQHGALVTAGPRIDRDRFKADLDRVVDQSL